MAKSKQTKRIDTPKLNTGKLVQLDQLKPGMLMAEDLRDFNGRLILQKGTPLDLKSLRLIRMWGITEALVESDLSSVKQDAQRGAVEANQDVVGQADRLFQFCDRNHPVMELLEQHFLHGAGNRTLKNGTDQVTEHTKNELNKIDISDQLEEEIQLPSLPTIVVRLNQALNHPSCTATHIADIIAKDTGLTARLLRLVNSGLYNFPTTIDSIPRAVTIIGSRQLSELAMASAVVSTFKDIPSELVDMTSFWKHSVACGIICRLLAGYRKNTNTESYFLAGLLHDIGRLILYLYFPAETRDLLIYAVHQPQLMHHLEQEYLGMDHGHIGALLIKRWQLPQILEEACRYHHEPSASSQKTVAAMVHIADIICNALQLGGCGETYVPPLSPKAWDELGLSTSVITPVIQQTVRILDESVNTYLSES